MAVATKTKAEVNVEKLKEKTREEIFLEYTIARQEAIHALIFAHLRSVGKDGCFICTLWDLRLDGFWGNGEEVINKFDVTIALSVFKRRKQIVVHGGLRVALMYSWL